MFLNYANDKGKGIEKNEGNKSVNTNTAVSSYPPPGVPVYAYPPGVPVMAYPPGVPVGSYPPHAIPAGSYPPPPGAQVVQYPPPPGAQVLYPPSAIPVSPQSPSVVSATAQTSSGVRATAQITSDVKASSYPPPPGAQVVSFPPAAGSYPPPPFGVPVASYPPPFGVPVASYPPPFGVPIASYPPPHGVPVTSCPPSTGVGGLVTIKNGVISIDTKNSSSITEKEKNEKGSQVKEFDIGKLELETNTNKKNNIFPKTPTLVIATSNYDGERYDHLDIKKDELLIVTDWNCGEKGWVYGHRKNNVQEKGIFPEVFIKVYEDKNSENKDKNTLKDEITPEFKIRFQNKINQFRLLNGMTNINTVTGIEVHRNNLFNDAYNGIMNKSPYELKKILRVKYIGEIGIDAGGLLRDFFYQMSEIIGNPNYSLFKYSHDNSYELEINPISSVVEPNYLQYYRFIGRVIGLAILNKQHIPISFIFLIYKRLLNKPLVFSDLEYVDSELYRNLQYLKNNSGAEYLYLTFSLDVEDCFGEKRTIDLKPNGSNIDVTDANKNEYINLVVDNKLNNSNDKEQLNALKLGFYEIIPNTISSILDEVDLKYLISGINTIDVDDWENNTDYEGYDKNDITIINFWKCVRKFSDENRQKLLVFATGNSHVPVTGFKDLQGNGRIQHFKLKRLGTENDLPKSHTCFNRIDLPPYTSFTIMRQKLLLAISEGMGAFDME